MKFYSYQKPKVDPLTPEEIKEKYKEIKEEMQEVLKWKKEEEAKLNNKKSTPQKIGVAKRALKKVERRIDTVNGQIIYWELRVKGESHFKASMEKNEYWAKCREEKEAREKEKVEKYENDNLPEILKSKKRAPFKKALG